MTTGIKADNRRAETTYRRRSWWLAGGGVSAVTVALALGLSGLFWGNTPSNSATARPTNRIFADERGYVLTVEEYQAALLEPINSLPVEAPAHEAGVSASSARCETAIVSGLALCRPQGEQPLRSGLRVNGPR